MIRREINRKVNYSGWMIGEHPINNEQYEKVIYLFGIKIFKYKYDHIENMEKTDESSQKTMGFSSNKTK